jgi:hypothetical protein
MMALLMVVYEPQCCRGRQQSQLLFVLDKLSIEFRRQRDRIEASVLDDVDQLHVQRIHLSEYQLYSYRGYQISRCQDTPTAKIA